LEENAHFNTIKNQNGNTSKDIRGNGNYFPEIKIDSLNSIENILKRTLSIDPFD